MDLPAQQKKRYLKLLLAGGFKGVVEVEKVVSVVKVEIVFNNHYNLYNTYNLSITYLNPKLNETTLDTKSVF